MKLIFSVLYFQDIEFVVYVTVKELDYNQRVYHQFYVLAMHFTYFFFDFIWVLVTNMYRVSRWIGWSNKSITKLIHGKINVMNCKTIFQNIQEYFIFINLILNKTLTPLVYSYVLWNWCIPLQVIITITNLHVQEILFYVLVLLYSFKN